MSRLTDQLTQLGVQVDAQLFELAFTHRSFAYENGRIPSNERLEFLGDAVLQIVVTEHIYRNYPDLAEGDLAKLRSAVVSSRALAEVARDLELGEHIKLGHGEVVTNGAAKSSILADTMEAIIGAIYLSGGTDDASHFIHRNIDPRIEKAQSEGSYTDFKTALQELCAEQGRDLPRYEISGSGPDHQRTFQAEAIIGAELLGHGEATSKKLAEQRAAAQAYHSLTAASDA